MADPLLAWTLIGAGAAGQAVAAALARRSLRWLNAGGRAVGRVVGNEEAMVERGKGSPQKFYFPVIEFESGAGAPTTFRSDTGRRTPARVGETLPVVFDPSRLTEARAATFRTLWFLPLLTSAFTLPFLVAGLVALA